MPEIILKNVTKRFGKFVAVDNLNLTIESNAFITLLGPSGCGKTTTLRMIAGLETPTEGSISIDGKIVFDADQGINLPPNKRDVGFLFQNYALWPHMTVYQNIAFGLENLKWDKAKIQARVKELLQMLRIEQFEKRYPSELSGGQQQRVAIARTLAPGPRYSSWTSRFPTWTQSCAWKCVPSSSACTAIRTQPLSTSRTTSWRP